MVKTIFAILVGVLVASMTLFLFGMISNYLDPTPAELMNSSDPEVVARRIASTSVSKWLAVIIGISVGSMIGSFTGAFLSSDNAKKVVSRITFLLSIWPAYTFYTVYPYELWVPISMLLGILLGSLAGLRLYRLRTSRIDWSQ